VHKLNQSATIHVSHERQWSGNVISCRAARPRRAAAAPPAKILLAFEWTYGALALAASSPSIIWWLVDPELASNSYQSISSGESFVREVKAMANDYEISDEAWYPFCNIMGELEELGKALDGQSRENFFNDMYRLLDECDQFKKLYKDRRETDKFVTALVDKAKHHKEKLEALLNPKH
jgi:hypothetical protein